jgi:hypothetical protein
MNAYVITEQNNRPRTCRTCAHRSGSRCNLSGFYMEVERKYPSKCGVYFEGWAPRESLLTRLKNWLWA